MTVSSWPSELPRPERSAWAKEPMEARIKRQGDGGTPSYRLQFSSVPEDVTLSVLLSRNGKAVFDRFYAKTTRRGSLPFYMADPTTDGWPLLTTSGIPLLTVDGRPILLARRWLCLFGDRQPQETVVGIQFRKTFSVTVMP